MRILIAHCSATYAGRGNTKLAPHKRTIIIKNDGAVLLHADKGVKPLNYMGTGAKCVEEYLPSGETVMRFDSRKESLELILHEVYADYEELMGNDDPGLVRDGTEDDLQEWLSNNVELFGEGYELVSREYPTGAGPVDLLLKHTDGYLLAVEVKRVAMVPSVDQVLRYKSALIDSKEIEVKALVAALDIRPNTAIYAAKRGVSTLQVEKSD